MVISGGDSDYVLPVAVYEGAGAAGGGGVVAAGLDAWVGRGIFWKRRVRAGAEIAGEVVGLVGSTVGRVGGSVGHEGEFVGTMG